MSDLHEWQLWELPIRTHHFEAEAAINISKDTALQIRVDRNTIANHKRALHFVYGWDRVLTKPAVLQKEPPPRPRIARRFPNSDTEKQIALLDMTLWPRGRRGAGGRGGGGRVCGSWWRGWGRRLDDKGGMDILKGGRGWQGSAAAHFRICTWRATSGSIVIRYRVKRGRVGDGCQLVVVASRVSFEWAVRSDLANIDILQRLRWLLDLFQLVITCCYALNTLR